MKRKAALAALTILMASMIVPASAHRYNRVDDGHPLRLVAYALHPIGIGLEYFVMRPVHRFVSQDDNDILFGHKAYLGDDETYYEWVHGDYHPSIAVEREQRNMAQRQLVR